MKIKCLSCNQNMNLNHQAFRNFRGSLRCIYCKSVMEIQMLGGILIWGYPVQAVKHDFTGRTPETNPYGEQKKI